MALAPGHCRIAIVLDEAHHERLKAVARLDGRSKAGACKWLVEHALDRVDRHAKGRQERLIELHRLQDYMEKLVWSNMRDRGDGADIPPHLVVDPGTLGYQGQIELLEELEKLIQDVEEHELETYREGGQPGPVSLKFSPKAK